MRRTSIALAASLLVASFAGAQDFSRFLVLGDSLTAGYQSNSAYLAGQQGCYGAILAEHIGTGFEQSTISEPGIPPQLFLEHLAPRTVIKPMAGLGQPTNLTYAGIYNNLGIVGAKTHDIVATTSVCGFNPSSPTCANPFYDLVLRNFAHPTTPSTAIQQAVAFTPTFTILWIGNNDVLSAALAGAAIDGVTLTPKAAFEQDFRSIVAALKSTGTALVIVNLPNVTSIPFVNTIPPVVVDPVTHQPVLDPTTGQPIPLIGLRQGSSAPAPLPPGTRVTLGASALLAQGIGIPTALGGTGLPLPDGGIINGQFAPGVLLYNEEISAISTRVGELNAVIATVAAENGVPVYDVNGLLDDVATFGWVYGGIDFDASFLTGGFFSYDGFHANGLGYAVIANELTKVIDANWDAGLGEINLFPYIFGQASKEDGVSPQFTFTREAWESMLKVFVPTRDIRIEAPVSADAR